MNLFMGLVNVSRPKTLFLSISPVITAYALCGTKEPVLFFLAGLSGVFIQIACNGFNDYLDFLNGVDKEKRKGDQRAVQSGKLTLRQAKVWSFVCLFLATIFGLYVVFRGGLLVLGVGICSLAAAYLYSGGTRPLSHTPFSGIFVLLFFGVIPVLILTLIVDFSKWPFAFVAGIQVGLLSWAVLAVNNLRDLVSDKKANKNTLCVVLGQRWAKYEVLSLYALVLVTSLFWFFQNMIFAFVLPFIVWIEMRAVVNSILKKSENYLNDSSEKSKNFWKKNLMSALSIQVIFSFQLALGLWFYEF